MSEKLKLFLDPGHGGQDPGAIGTNSKEAENVLKVALALEKKLKAQGYEVKLSRRTDTYLTLKQRADLANAWGADLFISLHDNSAVNKTATGFETFIFNGNVSGETIKLQQHVHKAIATGMGLRDRGMKRANFAVVRETNMPALLIEYGFISNFNDEKVIAFEIEKQSQLTLEGINNYLGVKAKPVNSTPTSEPAPATDNIKESGEIMLTETGRIAIRELVKNARDKGIISQTAHSDAKIAEYTDKQLLSYQAAILKNIFNNISLSHK